MEALRKKERQGENSGTILMVSRVHPPRPLNANVLFGDFF
jgi:hypothetical protein